MRIKLSLTLLSALLPLGCGQLTLPETEKDATTSDGAMSTEEQAANDLYLDDVEDSAAEDEVANAEVDASVEEDTKERRLQQMAEMLFTDLDADASSTLSLEEFLAGPAKRVKDDDVLAKMTAKMTADFTAYAGDDALLSIDELKTLLKEVGPRVGKHRCKKHGGRHEQRVKQSWEQIVAKFDADGDGKLSQAEFEALEAAREKDRPDGPGGPGRHGGPGGKKGPGGPMGPGGPGNGPGGPGMPPPPHPPLEGGDEGPEGEDDGV